MIIEALGRRWPFREKLKEQLRWAGIDLWSTRLAGQLMMASIIFAIAFPASLLLLQFDLIFLAIAAGIGFVAPQLLPQIILLLIASSRASKTEEILPDALQLISANLRAGMTVDRAVRLSSRPEFGPLADEIKHASSEVMGGAELPQALKGMTKRIKSKALARTIKLINEALHAGGDLAPLLDETARDIRTAESMRREARANVKMYAILIIFGTVIGAPFLFAVSNYFINVMVQVTGEMKTVPIEEAPIGILRGGMFKPGELPLTPEQIWWFSLAALLIISGFGSLLIGTIQTGETKKGLKFLPLLVGGSVGIFVAARIAIQIFFGGMLAF